MASKRDDRGGLLESLIIIMTQEEKWLIRYNEVKAFIEREHRNPSKHRIEEHDMLNWVKQQRKLLNAGRLKTERMEAFEKLLVLCEKYRRVNQTCEHDGSHCLKTLKRL